VELGSRWGTACHWKGIRVEGKGLVREGDLMKGRQAAYRHGAGD